MRHLLFSIALTSVAFASSSFASTAALPKIGWSLTGFDKVRGGSVDILVVMTEQSDLSGTLLLRDHLQKKLFITKQLRQTAETTQSPLRTWLDTSHIAYRSFSIMNAVAIRHASMQLVSELARRDDVERIISDRATPLDPRVASTKGIFTPAKPTTGVDENIHATGADTLWAQGFKGQGIVVAGADTGVEWTHPALQSHYRGATGPSVQHDFNWHDAIHAATDGNPAEGTSSCGYELKAPCDDGGHGSHTMGTMIGDDSAGNEIGMAPSAKWMACRNMNNEYGSPSTYLECYEWLLAPYALGADPKTGDPTKAPNIINNSWACNDFQGCQGEEMLPVLKAIHAAGILNVVAAGNYGPNCSTIKSEPATLSAYSLVVGAYDISNGKIARFSSRGPSTDGGAIGPDLVAPGVTVRSSVPSGLFANKNWSGTSMASPHVAGAVALLWSAQPKLVGEVDQTIALLKQTATPMKDQGHNCGGTLGSEVPNNTYGSGIMNVPAALAQALKL